MAKTEAIAAEVIGDIADAVNAGLRAIAPAAELVRQSIYERASRGKAVIGPNPAYKDRWARVRGFYQPADLWFEGKMFGSLAVRSGTGQTIDTSGRGSRFRDTATGRWATPTEVVIGFAPGEQSVKAAVHEFGGGNNVPPRPFFSLTPVEIGIIERKVLHDMDLRLDTRRESLDIELRVF